MKMGYILRVGGSKMAEKCPYCNQLISTEDSNSFADSTPCGACQRERFTAEPVNEAETEKTKQDRPEGR